NHLERFFAGGADGWAEHLDVGKHFENILIEAEISDSARDFSIFDEERSVASHAGENFFVGIDFTDVPESGDENSALGGTNHVVERFVAPAENEIHGGFAVFIGKAEAVAGGLRFHFFGGGAGVHEIFRDAAIDEKDFLFGETFAIVGRAQLMGMIDVVPEGDVIAKNFFAHAVVEAGAFVENGGAC